MINKTIFFVTNDVDDMHVDFFNNIEFVKKQNPSYNVEVYDNKRFEEYYKKINPEHYEKYYCKLNKNLGALIGDYMRYVLMYYEGGVYMDLKSRPKHKLENWINNKKKDYLFRWTTKSNDEILQWFLSSEKNNELFREMIDVIHYKIDNYNNNNVNIKNTRINILNFSGPRIFTKVWEKHALEVNDNWHEYLIRVAVKDYKNKYNNPHYSKVFEQLVVNQ